MANFEKIYNKLMIIEGGETMYGITKHEGKEMYEELFFNKYHFYLIQNTKIAGELFEFTVNTGKGDTAVKFLQRSYNLLNKNITLKEDGILGPQTASTINSYKFYKSLYKTLNIFQGMYYIFIAENDVTAKEDLLLHKERSGSQRLKTFIRGWIDRRVSI